MVNWMENLDEIEMKIISSEKTEKFWEWCSGRTYLVGLNGYKRERATSILAIDIVDNVCWW